MALWRQEELRNIAAAHDLQTQHSSSRVNLAEGGWSGCRGGASRDDRGAPGPDFRTWEPQTQAFTG